MQTKVPLSQALEIPEDIICPITQQIMTDPVMLVESGHTYEREAILDHLKNKQTDPLTNQPIASPAIAPNHTVKKMIVSFLEKQRTVNPTIHHETYLPQSWIQDLLTAMEKEDISRLKDTLKKDNRLLLNPLKENKTFLMLACELASLPVLEVVIAQLGDQLKQLEEIKKDNGLSYFLMVARRLGTKGAACMAKGLDWKSADFQALLVSSVEENAHAMVDMALSLGAMGTPELLSHAYLKNKLEVLKRLILAGVSIEQENLLSKVIENHQEALIEFLLTETKSIVNPNVNSQPGKLPPLLLAVLGNQPKIISLLLNLPTLNIAQMDEKGNTALHYAAMQGNQEIVKLLMKRGLSIKTQNHDQKKPSQLARENAHYELGNWMEERHRYIKMKPFLKPLKTQLKAQAVEIAQLREALEAVKSTALQQPTTKTSTPIRTDSQTSSSSTSLSSSTNTFASTSSTFLNPFSTIFHPASSALTLNQPKLTYSQQVEATSKMLGDKVNVQELYVLLKWATKGHLEEVEKLLKKNPTLALSTATVTDLSDRTFTNITVLQYAAWTLDAEMVELIIPYIGAHHSAIQMKALAESPEIYSVHGASYDMTSLVNKYQTYIDNYSKWDGNQCCEHWQKEIGGEQRKCPAWLIYAWSEGGDDVAWTKQDPNRKIKREYDKHRLEWWFTQNYNNGCGVGSAWAALRAHGPERWLVHNGMYKGRQPSFWVHDQKCVLDFGITRREILQRLRASVDHSLSQNSTVVLKNNSATMPRDSHLEVSNSASSSFSTNEKLFSHSPLSFRRTPLKAKRTLLLKYSRQVEIASQAVQDKINPQELAAFLKWGTEGHLLEVEKLLKKNPALALGIGKVTDLSGRTFKNITVLQYAAWALDSELCELILRYIDVQKAFTQFKALSEEPEYYSVHGASYDFTPLVTKTKTYVDNWANWSYEKCCEYWQKEVGGEQRKCPAWLIYAWSEEGADVAWTKHDANRKVKREYDKLRLTWWFTGNYNKGCGVGSSWAAVRHEEVSFLATHLSQSPALSWSWRGNRHLAPILKDGECVALFCKSRYETLQQVRAEVEMKATSLILNASSSNSTETTSTEQTPINNSTTYTTKPPGFY